LVAEVQIWLEERGLLFTEFSSHDEKHNVNATYQFRSRYPVLPSTTSLHFRQSEIESNIYYTKAVGNVNGVKANEKVVKCSEVWLGGV
jgi:hypothetical protein